MFAILPVIIVVISKDLSNVPTTKPGCWLQFPSGCPKQTKYKHFQNTTAWLYENWQGSSYNQTTCYDRQGDINGWCGVIDVVTVYVQGISFY